MADDLKRVWDKAVRAAELRNRIPGRLGKPGGAVVVTARPGYLYVRLSSEGGQNVVIARNDGVPRLYDLPVWLELEHNTYVISGVDGTRLEAFIGTADSGGGGVGYHTHRIGSGLEYEVEALRLEPGRVKPVAGMTVSINQFRYWTGSAWQTYPGGLLDLTSYKPSASGTQAWVLVGINPATNTAVAVTGAEYSTFTPLTLELLDDISFDSYIPIVGIRVRADDTAVSDMNRYASAQAWLDYPAAASSGGVATATIDAIMIDADGYVMVDADGNVMVES
jgi:hypothetical protein